jgi:hypothetical protein
MLAKGFAVNGCTAILVDISEEFLSSSKFESEKATKSVGREANVHTYVKVVKPTQDIRC